MGAQVGAGSAAAGLEQAPSSTRDRPLCKSACAELAGGQDARGVDGAAQGRAAADRLPILTGRLSPSPRPPMQATRAAQGQASLHRSVPAAQATGDVCTLRPVASPHPLTRTLQGKIPLRLSDCHPSSITCCILGPANAQSLSKKHGGPCWGRGLCQTLLTAMIDQRFGA